MDTDERIDRLREELQIIRHQLGLAKAEVAQYQRLLLQQSQSSPPLNDKEMDQVMNVGTPRFSKHQLDSTLMNKKYDDDIVDGDSVSCLVPYHASIEPSRQCHTKYCTHEGNVVYKFVPPLEFLPAVFVAVYRDVIEVIEKYAQLYHRFAGDNALSVTQQMQQ
ncbi:hypothetical protein LSM04_009119 [Trypanosoma melophagium]|uniref:uncharacterized protein n=1 Tax=Trypanosoma melophagium TaxID=715481 RepID=UPI00351A811D|nr:hypothetical protein LSM04_009119 [Trypanosoma melophagium]